MEIFNAPLSSLPKLDRTFSVYSDEKLQSVIETLKKYNIGCVPVLERGTGKVVGVFTERDYLKKVDFNDPEIDEYEISKFMTSNPKSLDINASLAKAALLMSMGKFRHIIVTKDDMLERVVSIKDLLDWLIDREND